jgi:hypothetical protein
LENIIEPCDVKKNRKPTQRGYENKYVMYRRTDMATKITDLVGKLNDIDLTGGSALNSILEQDLTDGNKRMVLNTKALLISLVSSVFGLTNENMNNPTIYSPEDLNKINKFFGDLVLTVEKFCKFLDYDNDGRVELIGQDKNGKIIVGEDIELIVADIKYLSSAVNNNNLNKGSAPLAILATLSALTIYLSNDNYLNAKDDYEQFKEACGKTYNSFKLFKEINHSKQAKESIKNNIDNIISFVIIFCIISIPIIDLVSKKANDIKSGEKVIITKEMIQLAIINMYGLDLDFITKSIEGLVKVFGNTLAVSGCGSKLSQFFKKKCCCC